MSRGRSFGSRRRGSRGCSLKLRAPGRDGVDHSPGGEGRMKRLDSRAARDCGKAHEVNISVVRVFALRRHLPHLARNDGLNAVRLAAADRGAAELAVKL